MKYLKRFNESNTDDVIQTVKDILLPISDMGYEISVDEGIYYKQFSDSELVIRVVTYVDKPLLITDEVKEEFIRMKDYLESEGYNSIEAQYYTRDFNNKYVKEFDQFIDVFDWYTLPIVNLLFNAKKIL